MDDTRWIFRGEIIEYVLSFKKSKYDILNFVEISIVSFDVL